MAKQKFTEFADDLEDPTAEVEKDKGSEEGGEKGAENKEENGDDKSDESGDASDDSGAGDGEGSESGGDGDDKGEGDEAGKESGDDSEKESETKDDGKGGEGSDSGEEDGDGEGAESKEASGDAEDDKSAGKDADGDESGAEDKGDGESKEEEDFFAEEPADAGDKGDEGKVSFKPIAEKLGIELENDTEEELVKKYNEKLESAKQELKLDEYNDQARSLIKHLNDNTGDVGKFLTNPVISEMQNLLSMEPEDKVRMIRINEIRQEDKVDEAKATEKYNEELEEMSVSDIRKMSDNIDTQAQKLRDEEIVKITGDKEAQLKEDRKKADLQVEKEVDVLKNYIKAQDEVLGLKLTEKAKAQILADLETGNFDSIVEKSPEASKFFAYMTGKHGPKIIENFSKSKSEANREGYNKATDKQTSALHNDKKSASGKAASGHQKGEEGTKKNFDTWQDKDLFGDEDE